MSALRRQERDRGIIGEEGTRQQARGLKPMPEKALIPLHLLTSRTTKIILLSTSSLHPHISSSPRPPLARLTPPIPRRSITLQRPIEGGGGKRSPSSIASSALVFPLLSFLVPTTQRTPCRRSSLPLAKSALVTRIGAGVAQPPNSRVIGSIVMIE